MLFILSFTLMLKKCPSPFGIGSTLRVFWVIPSSLDRTEADQMEGGSKSQDTAMLRMDINAYETGHAHLVPFLGS